MRYILYKFIAFGSRKIQMWFYIYWNRLIFRMAGVSFGKRMQVFNRLYLSIARSSYINIGKNFLFLSGDNFNPLCRNIRGGIFAAPNAYINIGDNVGISSASIWASKSITIHNNVNIGGDCIIMDTDAHNLNHKIRRIPEKDSITAHSAPIVIEDDVLVGTRCIILKGVTIGARSIIGAGSVVTKSIPPDSIAAGNPCKVIRTNTL